MIFNYCIFISSILLLLSMIESIHAWPLLMNKKQSVLQNQLFNDYNEDIVLIIPKPDIDNNNNKFHTVSCFQDILDEEENEKENNDDLMFLFDNEEGYYYDEDYKQQGYESSATAFYGVLDFFIMIKDTFNSILEYNWSSNWENNITEFDKEEKDEKFQLYFDV